MNIPESKIYKGSIEITEENQSGWEEKLKKIWHITGSLSINSNASFPALKSIGGYLYIYSNTSLKADALKSIGGSLSINAQIDEALEKQLWSINKNNQWYLSDVCSDWLLSRTGKIKYFISGLEFSKPLFDAIRKGDITAPEVFAITNIEQRRIAYERMDKIKMKELQGYKNLNEDKDKYGNKMSVVSFQINGFVQSFKYLHCICPSTGREYFLETKKDDCQEAKMASFGLNKDVEFREEW